jgi:ribosomal-protein-alanine N-acetyltransferase
VGYAAFNAEGQAVVFKDLHLEAERLVIRPFTIDDAEALHKIVNQEDVMRFLPEGVMSLDEVKRTLTWLIDCYGKNTPQNIVKFSVAVVLKDSEELIGWVGLGPLDFEPAETEIYFGLARAHWGKGLATEAAGAMLRFGLQVIGLPRIVAVVNQENAASVCVIEKLGMKYVMTVHGLPREHRHYEGVRCYSIESAGVRQSVDMPDYYRTTYSRLYELLARFYDLFLKVFFFLFNGGFGSERRWRQEIVSWLDPQPGEKIIDLCSGTGTLSIMIAERLSGTGEVVGIELSPAQLRVALSKQRPSNLSFMEGDSQNTPFPDTHFDRAVICGALHELPHQVRRNVLAEANRLIKPGGRLVSMEHNKPTRKWKAILYDLLERPSPEYPTYRDLLQHGQVVEIERAGFRTLKTTTTASDYFQMVLADKPI